VSGAKGTAGPDATNPSAPSDAARTQVVVSTLTDAFAALIAADPRAFTAKFRTMARDPFAFYRGSAVLFYRDVTTAGPYAGVDDRWVDAEARRVWIQGDLHAENFGTYMDARGRLVFDVNDFDEAYLGHWTWDVLRFSASLALLCWQKALPDDVIDRVVASYVRSYADQVEHYRTEQDDSRWALTLETSSGAVLAALRRAKLSSRVALLESATVVDQYARRFAQRSGVRRLEGEELEAVRTAFTRYVDTVPDATRGGVTFDVLDAVRLAGLGVGSAGLPAYSVLIEGYSQALDNDVVLTLKQGNVAAPSRVVDDEVVRSYFEHHGHRTAVSQHALHAQADRFLGWTELAGTDGPQTGFVVSEFSPYTADLDWADVLDVDDIDDLVSQLGRATAKIHCVADDESEHDLVGVSVEEVVARCIGEDVDALVGDVTAFAHAYAAQVRRDHRLFVDAFRSGAFSGVTPT
jgi:uncharacterized protein (DUF2252 family)